MKSKSTFWHILLSFVLLVAILLTGIASYVIAVLQDMYYESVRESLLAQARIIETRVTSILEHEPDFVQTVCMELKSNSISRVTIILPDGRVVGDTQERPAVMDNHAGRPEILAAMGDSGDGMSIRKSRPLNIDMMYSAIPVWRDGALLGVIRTSMPLTTLRENYGRIRLRILMGAGVALLVALALSLLVSHRISRPMKSMIQAAQHFATGDFSMRVHVSGSAEVELLADSMNWMAAQLDERISTIKQQQDEMQAIISSMEEGVMALDTSNIIISMNQSAARMLNTTVRQSVGKMLEEVVRHQMLCCLVHDVRGGSAMLESDVTIHEESGMRYVQVRATPLRSGGQRKIGVLLVMNDVTRLRHLEKVRREFVANVSHELKTPVTSIQGFVETLLEGDNDPESAGRFLEIIRRQTSRLNAIIEDLLNLSRLERDREHGDIHLQRVALSLVLENAVESCRPEAERKRIALQMEAPSELEVELNAELMEQAVVNLINNAVKYSEEDRHVYVRAWREEDGVRISVTDEGMGIAAEHLPRLFERFYRVDKNRSRQMGGTGLGLAIVKHIVMAHQGTVDVRSEQGRGSCFTICLPC